MSGRKTQSYRGCYRGKAKLLRMSESKNKVTEDVGEEDQSDRGREGEEKQSEGGW